MHCNATLPADPDENQFAWCPLLRPQEGGAAADGAAESEALLPLLLVGEALAQRLSQLEAALREGAAEAAQRLLQGQQGGKLAVEASACDAVAAARLRLTAQPHLRQALATFADAAARRGSGSGAAAPLLASASAAVGEAKGTIEGLVFDVLLGRVRAQLQVGAGVLL